MPQVDFAALALYSRADKVGVSSPTPKLVLQAFTHRERSTMLPAVRLAVSNAGGWMLSRKDISASTVQLQIELQHRRMVDLYAALIASGIEFTRSAHLSLTESCACTQQMPERRRQIAMVEIGLWFVSELNLESLMQTSTASA